MFIPSTTLIGLRDPNACVIVSGKGRAGKGTGGIGSCRVSKLAKCVEPDTATHSDDNIVIEWKYGVTDLCKYWLWLTLCESYSPLSHTLDIVK